MAWLFTLCLLCWLLLQQISFPGSRGNIQGLNDALGLQDQDDPMDTNCGGESSPEPIEAPFIIGYRLLLPSFNADEPALPYDSIFRLAQIFDDVPIETPTGDGRTESEEDLHQLRSGLDDLLMISDFQADEVGVNVNPEDISMPAGRVEIVDDSDDSMPPLIWDPDVLVDQAGNRGTMTASTPNLRSFVNSFWSLNPANIVPPFDSSAVLSHESMDVDTARRFPVSHAASEDGYLADQESADRLAAARFRSRNPLEAVYTGSDLSFIERRLSLNRNLLQSRAQEVGRNENERSLPASSVAPRSRSLSRMNQARSEDTVEPPTRRLRTEHRQNPGAHGMDQRPC